MKNFTFAMKWHEILKPYSEEIEMQPLARMAFDFIRYEIDEKARTPCTSSLTNPD